MKRQLFTQIDRIVIDIRYRKSHMSTSIQHIIVERELSSINENIQQLFRPKSYPRFELQEFCKHHLYDKHEQFRFFIDILDEWNRKIDKNEVPNCSDTLLKKNIFIFNSLRNVIFKKQEYAADILNSLYRWFNKTRTSKMRLAQKRQVVNYREDDDWEIRNTFKSTLPSEIGIYRRRVFWNCEPFGNQRTSFMKPNIGSGLLDLKNRIVKTQVDEDIVVQVQPKDFKGVEEKKIQRIENQIIRSERETTEMANIHKRWKMKKNREDQENIKNFYQKAFSTNKMYFSQKRIKHSQPLTRPILEQRVYTSLGARNKKSTLPFHRYSQSKTLQQDLRRDLLNRQPQGKSFFQDTDKNQQENILHKSKLQIIDGMHLLSNPLQTKLKKKIRKN